MLRLKIMYQIWQMSKLYMKNIVALISLKLTTIEVITGTQSVMSIRFELGLVPKMMISRNPKHIN